MHQIQRCSIKVFSWYSPLKIIVHIVYSCTFFKNKQDTILYIISCLVKSVNDLCFFHFIFMRNAEIAAGAKFSECERTAGAKFSECSTLRREQILRIQAPFCLLRRHFP